MIVKGINYPPTRSGKNCISYFLRMPGGEHAWMQVYASGHTRWDARCSLNKIIKGQCKFDRFVPYTHEDDDLCRAYSRKRRPTRHNGSYAPWKD